VRSRSFSLVISSLETRAFQENGLTYLGRLCGSCCGGGDVVGIAHGQKSIHRTILVPADGVDNRMPREILVTRVREQRGKNFKRQHWARKLAAYKMAASKPGKMACSEDILGSANSLKAGCSAGSGEAEICACVSSCGCASLGGVVATTVTLSLTVDTGSGAPSCSTVGDRVGGDGCGCGSSSRL
jgi:hypothetical protein